MKKEDSKTTIKVNKSTAKLLQFYKKEYGFSSVEELIYNRIIAKEK
jgi:hypothetical protein